MWKPWQKFQRRFSFPVNNEELPWNLLYRNVQFNERGRYSADAEIWTPRPSSLRYSWSQYFPGDYNTIHQNTPKYTKINRIKQIPDTFLPQYAWALLQTIQLSISLKKNQKNMHKLTTELLSIATYNEIFYKQNHLNIRLIHTIKTNYKVCHHYNHCFQK